MRPQCAEYIKSHSTKVIVILGMFWELFCEVPKHAHSLSTMTKTNTLTTASSETIDSNLATTAAQNGIHPLLFISTVLSMGVLEECITVGVAQRLLPRPSTHMCVSLDWPLRTRLVCKM